MEYLRISIKRTLSGFIAATTITVKNYPISFEEDATVYDDDIVLIIKNFNGSGLQNRFRPLWSDEPLWSYNDHDISKIKVLSVY